MAYSKRLDGRDWTELRPMEAKIKVIPNADGSAYFKAGKTVAYAAVYGPREIFPKFLQNPKKGILRCFYNLLPFSGTGERIRPGGNRRAAELSYIIEEALGAVVDLSQFPNTVVDIFIDFIEADAGSRCVALNAAVLALAEAGIPMTDLISAVAVGRVEDKLLVDLTYGEESYSEKVVDLPVAMTNNTKEVVLLQMDGLISKEDLLKALELSKPALEKIFQLQKKTLLEGFQNV